LRTSPNCTPENLTARFLARHVQLGHGEVFLGERGNDFFKARIATQRIPKGKQFQLTIAEGARRTHRPIWNFEKLKGSRLLFLAEFLETRIIPERIKHGIEPEQRRSERHVFVECARARY